MYAQKDTSRMDVKVAGGRSIADHVMEAYESCCQPQERNEGRKPQGCDEAQNEGSQGDEAAMKSHRPGDKQSRAKRGTKGTCAGRRPNATNQELIDLLRDTYFKEAPELKKIGKKSDQLTCLKIFDLCLRARLEIHAPCLWPDRCKGARMALWTTRLGSPAGARA